MVSVELIETVAGSRITALGAEITV